jgi:hypothetical protein
MGVEQIVLALSTRRFLVMPPQHALAEVVRAALSPRWIHFRLDACQT